MSEEINQNRRCFLANAAMTIAAAQVGMIGSAEAQSKEMKPADLPTIQPGPSTSFGSMKQIDAGVLNVGCAEAGRGFFPASLITLDGSCSSSSATQWQWNFTWNADPNQPFNATDAQL